MKRLISFFVLLLVFESGFSKNIVVSNSQTEINVDGFLAPGEWAVKDSAYGFIQMEPFKGEPATQRTVVLILQSKTHLYFAFKCYTSHQDKIVANIQNRDQVSKSDDVVLIMLDTFNDNRNAYGFAMNPLSTQRDFRIADDGRSIDANWDTEWKSASRRTEWGWICEFAIPFKSIQYDPKQNVWGINFGRVIRENTETVYWAGALNEDFRVSQGGKLLGVRPPYSETGFNISPYVTTRYDDSSGLTNINNTSTELGADISYALTSGITANATINPDFATVEGDQEQINLTRWELQFPEKRLFFLEGGELFKTRINTFYSRRIGDIEYGGKMTGKTGDYNFSLLGVRTIKDQALAQPQSYFSVLRVKKDILKSSNIGITAVDKSWDNNYTRSFSADYVLNLGNSWKLTGQWVSSAPGDFIKSSAWFIRAARESNIYHYHIRYSDTGENFQDNVNQTGFIKDDDMREIDSDISYRWWLIHPIIKYIQIDTKNNFFWSHTGTLRSWNVREIFRTYMHNRFSIDFQYENEFKRYEKDFYNHNYTLGLGYNTDEWASTGIEYTFGKNYDRDFNLLNGYFRIKPLTSLALDYSFNKLNYSPDPSNAKTLINILSINYNFTPDLWFKVFTQNNTRNDRYYIYGLFGWRFLPPFGALYLVMTRDQYEPIAFNIQKNRIYYLKFSYRFGY